jgi:hypothetical protein
LAKRLNYRVRVYQDDTELRLNSSLVTFLTSKVTDDIGLMATQIKVPASTGYTSYEPAFIASPLFTYFLDVSNDTESPLLVKLNGETTEFSISPDVWVEKVLESMLIKNDGTNDKVILMIQAYPRVLSFT